MLDLNTSIQYVKGVGPRRTKLFKKLGIETINDALFFIPLRYEDRRHIEPIERISLNSREYKTVLGKIVQAKVKTTFRHKKLFEVILSDNTGFLTCIWFRFNERYMPPLSREMDGRLVCYRDNIGLRHMRMRQKSAADAARRRGAILHSHGSAVHGSGR